MQKLLTIIALCATLPAIASQVVPMQLGNNDIITAIRTQGNRIGSLKDCVNNHAIPYDIYDIIVEIQDINHQLNQIEAHRVSNVAHDRLLNRQRARLSRLISMLDDIRNGVGYCAR